MLAAIMAGHRLNMVDQAEHFIQMKQLLETTPQDVHREMTGHFESNESYMDLDNFAFGSGPVDQEYAADFADSRHHHSSVLPERHCVPTHSTVIRHLSLKSAFRTM